MVQTESFQKFVKYFKHKYTRLNILLITESHHHDCHETGQFTPIQTLRNSVSQILCSATARCTAEQCVFVFD